MHDEDEDRFLGGPLDHVARWMLYFIASCLMIAIVMAGWLTFAQAHESMGHMQYEAFCCQGNAHTGDCQEIPDSAVRTIPGGYQITLKPGDHRLVTRVHVWQKTQVETRWSTDGRFHACLYPNEDTLRCFYAPPPSF